MPLSADPADWADRLLAFRSEIRDEACVAAVQKQIRDRGFDIESEIHLYD